MRLARRRVPMHLSHTLSALARSSRCRGLGRRRRSRCRGLGRRRRSQPLATPSGWKEARPPMCCTTPARAPAPGGARGSGLWYLQRPHRRSGQGLRYALRSTTRRQCFDAGPSISCSRSRSAVHNRPTSRSLTAAADTGQHRNREWGRTTALIKPQGARRRPQVGGLPCSRQTLTGVTRCIRGLRRRQCTHSPSREARKPRPTLCRRMPPIARPSFAGAPPKGRARPDY